MAILVIGATCSLGELVVDKLLSMDIDVIAKEESHRVRNKTLLEYSLAILSEEGSGFSISFDGSEADIVIGKNLIIHDLIPTRDDRWMASEFRDWAIGKENTGRPRFWLSVFDAANAIAQILKAQLTLEEVQMCGRREWSSIDSQTEFEMLWQRTIKDRLEISQPRLCLVKTLQEWRQNQSELRIQKGPILPHFIRFS